MESTWSVVLAVAALLTRTSNVWAVECEIFYVPFPAHDNCLYLSTGSSLTWDGAHINCAQYGNTLVNIDSPEAALQLRNILASKSPSTTEIWTGLKDHWQEGQYRWSRGELLADDIFAAGEPNDVSRSQNCMSAKHATGTWAWRMYDRPCSTTNLPHVCENWPNDKKSRGGTFSRQYNVTEANLNLEVRSVVQGNFRACREACLGNAYCEAVAMDTATNQCKILFFKEQSLAQRQSLLAQLATYKIYLRTSFYKHY